MKQVLLNLTIILAVGSCLSQEVSLFGSRIVVPGSTYKAQLTTANLNGDSIVLVELQNRTDGSKISAKRFTVKENGPKNIEFQVRNF